MILFEKIDLLIYALIISILTIMFVNKTSFKKKFINYTFKFSVFSVIMYLIFDIGAISVDGLQGNLNFALHYLFIFFIYFFGPFAPFFWVLLIDYKIFMDDANFRRRIKILYIYPVLINAVLSFLSIFTGWFFVMDKNNLYMRGDLFPIHATVYVFYFTIITAFIFKFKNRLGKKFFLSNLIVLVFPFSIGIIQGFFYKLELVWPTIAISIMVYFFIYQSNQLNYDYLTGLHNRRSLDEYLKVRLKKGSEEFGGIMIDIFRFKLINDKYGHKIGDEVLIDVGKILRDATENGDFLCRYAGDEFFIVSEVSEESELQKRISRINETLDEYNGNGKFAFEISLSVGGVLYKESEHKDPNAFISDADVQMYKIKNRQKRDS